MCAALVGGAHPQLVNVRFWHKADMSWCTAHARFRG